MDDKERTLKAFEDMKESMAYAVRRRATADVVTLEAQVLALQTQLERVERETIERLDMLESLADMWNDRHKPDELRTYIPGAFTLEMERVIRYVRALPSAKTANRDRMMLIDDKQARETAKRLRTYEKIDQATWLPNDPHKLMNEAATVVESLSAQVAAQREEEDRLEHTLALVRMDRDHNYERAKAAEAQVAELQQKSIATRAFDCKELEAQVAELKKDAERVLYRQCSKHEGMAYTFMVTTMPYTRIVCPQCDAAKESGVSP